MCQVILYLFLLSYDASTCTQTDGWESSHKLIDPIIKPLETLLVSPEQLKISLLTTPNSIIHFTFLKIRKKLCCL